MSVSIYIYISMYIYVCIYILMRNNLLNLSKVHEREDADLGVGEAHHALGVLFDFEAQPHLPFRLMVAEESVRRV